MQIKSFCPRLRKQLAFTMIELLIVIAILGILAVAVLSAINPIEQINRGRDTGTRSDAEQLISAIERFYAMTGYYPWNAAVGDPATLAWTEADITNLLGLQAPFTDCPVLYRLSEVPAASAGDCNNEPGTLELKLGFVSKLDGTTDNPLFVYHDVNSSDSTYVCFAPQSNAFQQEARERISGTLASDYPPDGVGYNRTDDVCGTEGDCICLP
jgi:prepilin-type N-terminal cleavage/methylation domain-containing protein